MVDDSAEQALRESYCREARGERMVRSLRTGIAIVIGLNTSFVLLDYWAFPDQFWSLLVTRLVLDVLLAGLYWRTRDMDPLIATQAGCYITGFGLVVVIGIAGGVTTHYSPGRVRQRELSWLAVWSATNLIVGRIVSADVGRWDDRPLQSYRERRIVLAGFGWIRLVRRNP